LTMSMQNYERALELIDEIGSGDFEGAKSEALVEKAEIALGLKFPPSYRRFLLELGCGDIEGVEVYGIIDDNFEKSSIPNGIWMTLNQREAIDLKNQFVIVGEDGDGTLHAIDTGVVESGESPVVRLSVDGRNVEKMANDFGSYLLSRVEEVA